MVMAWKEKFHRLVVREEEILKGELPFVEPGSLKEEYIFNELEYLKRQMNTIVKYIKL